MGGNKVVSRALTTSAFLYAIVGSAASLAGGKASELQLSAKVEPATVAPCQEIRVHVWLSNPTDEPEFTPAVLQIPHYWLDINFRSPDGTRIQYLGPEIQIVGIEEQIALYPDMFFGTSFSLTCSDYDYSTRGDYTIQAVFGRGPTRSRDVPNAISNTVTLAVRADE